jgi:diguanylate cyclase (GGDEF)-like protein
LGFLAGGLGSIFDTQRAYLPHLTVLASPAHWVAVYCLMRALLVRHNADFPRRPLIALAIAAISLHICLYFIWPSVPARIVALSIIMPTLISLGLPALLRATKTAIDKGVALLVIAAVASYIARLAMIVIQRQFSEVPYGAGWSQYVIIFYLAMATLGILTALVVMLATGVDLISAQIRQSAIDPLTGIANRRAVDKWIETDAIGPAKYSALLMIDLDHFKRINDGHGHATCDDVLCAVARELQAKIGNFADVARIGGEEFVALVHSADASGAGVLALTVRNAIAAIRLPAPLDGVRLTASVGLAVRQPHTDLRELMKRADMATYQAKAAGRNVAMQATERDGLMLMTKVA